MKFIFFILIFLGTLFANPQKEILLLHSYNNGLKWSDTITEGIKSVLSRYPNYELTIEYMDSKKITNEEYFNILHQLYKKKFSNRNYDVIITADNFAFNFALSNHKEIFNNSQIVFCGVENFESIKIPNKLKNTIPGVIEYKEIKENIALIKDVIKDLNTIYIISDDTLSSKAIKKQIVKAMSEFKNDINIIFDNKIDIHTLDKKVKNLPENSAILFTSLYKDINKEYVPYSHLREFFNNSAYPVFALNSIHLGQGVIGGIMVEPFEQGRLAALKTVDILQDIPVHDINISTPPSKYYFDHEVLKKFNLLNSDIPLFSNIINKPKGFFEKNRKFIDSAFILMPLLILLIIGLIVNIIKKFNLEIKLLEQNKLDNVLLNNIKSIIFWKSNEGIILGCNDYLCDFLNLSKDEIIGRKLRDISPNLCLKVDDSISFVGELETTLEKDGKTINVLIRRKKYLNKKNIEAGIVTIINDITQIKKLENRRKKDEQFTIQRSKLSEIGEMMTSIAHQWKAPLIEISTIAQELLYKKEKKNFSLNDSKEFVDEIMTQVKYMTNTIDDFRDFIKPSLRKSEFEINSSLEQLLRVIEHNIKYNYINIDITYENDKKYLLYGYVNEFKQAILNIINNSKDSILKRRQSEDFEGKISIKVNSINGFTSIYIQDNGIGIKEENQDKIFEPFYTTKKNGDGFGLYMVKLMIEEKMGGTIRAQKSDVGACIFLSIKNRLENENITT
ncbi:ABC transporter substrate binding protein [uncultured Arcobacter sp.]|uniref:ABC transporter substrate binding protein n=1 Tax=uncultured Arcobacter sp. TaxID=165434 RepID=UPI00262260BF|nr:ABC transporter substrate binding protein [uncultured Arcobacter sp.]